MAWHGVGTNGAMVAYPRFMAGLGRAWRGKAGQGAARRGWAGRGQARQGHQRCRWRIRDLRLGKAGRGLARHGMARAPMVHFNL